MSIIPKTIHYCWFGKNDMPLKLKQYVDDWKNVLPDYEFVLWDENSFDVHSTDFTSQAYDNKMWAFVSDYVRLYALYQYGGIYLDADVEMLKSFDSLLENEAFLGFESRMSLGSAVMGSRKEGQLIENLFNLYAGKQFVDEHGQMDKTANTTLFSKYMMKEYGLKLNNKDQRFDSVTVYPSEYFYPLQIVTKKLAVTDRSFCIHHWEGSWNGGLNPIKKKMWLALYDVFGTFLTEEAYKQYKKIKDGLKTK